MWHFLKFSPSLFPYLPILQEKSLKMSHEIRSVQTKPNIILYLKFNLGLGGASVLTYNTNFHILLKLAVFSFGHNSVNARSLKRDSR